MKMPEKLKIGGHTWTIKYHPSPLKNSKGQDLYGLCSFDEHTISIVDDMPSQSKDVEILLHELVHALLAFYGTGLKMKDEEQVCLNLGQGLAMVLRDNQKLLKYLKEALS